MAFPEISYCLICDVARAEDRGKVSILGFLGIAPSVSVYIQNFALPVALSFVLITKQGKGRYSVSFDIVGSDEKPVVPETPREPTDVDSSQPQNFLMVGITATYPGPGRYAFRLRVDGQPIYNAPFELHKLPA